MMTPHETHGVRGCRFTAASQVNQDCRMAVPEAHFRDRGKGQGQGQVAMPQKEPQETGCIKGLGVFGCRDGPQPIPEAADSRAIGEVFFVVEHRRSFR